MSICFTDNKQHYSKYYYVIQKNMKINKLASLKKTKLFTKIYLKLLYNSLLLRHIMYYLEMWGNNINDSMNYK